MINNMSILDNRKIRKLLILLFAIVINIAVFMIADFRIKGDLVLKYTVKSEQVDTYQMFYSDGTDWSEENSVRLDYTNTNTDQILKYPLEEGTIRVRIDLGNKSGTILLSNPSISYLWRRIDISNKILNHTVQTSDIGAITTFGNNIKIEKVGQDAYVVLDISDLDVEQLMSIDLYFNYIFKMLVCIAINILLFIFIKRGLSIKLLGKELYNNRRLIWNLSKNDFKTKYAGSYLGIIWAFVQPVVTVLVYWFVFQVGFKSGTVKDFPYILWLISGLVPWFFFSDALLNATNSMMEYSYLVKKVVFKISILPIVKIISALFVHLFFIGFTLILFLAYGHKPNIYTLQVIYYTFCMFIFVLGVSYITCAVIIFFKDLGQIIGILLQVGIWMTPIMWSYSMIEEGYQWILKLNPMYYIVEGYRDSLINHVWFWERFNQTIYFWVLTIGVFALGTIIFKRLKVHFADVL